MVLLASGLVVVSPARGADASSLTYDTLDAVSCPTATTTFCEAVGWYDNTSSIPQMLAETWNGTAWSVRSPAEPAGNDGSVLYGVSCLSATYCEAVGYYSKDVNGTNVQYPLAEVWTGTAWAMQAPARWKNHYSPYLASVSCGAVGSCEAAGDSIVISGGDVPAAFAEGLSGSAWTRQSVPRSGGFTYGMSCVSSTACEMVGEFGGRTLAEGWDGSAWSTQTTPDPTGDAVLLGVSCLAGASTTCQAVGSSKPEGWNGTTWTTEKFADPNGTVAMSAVSCATPSDCETVGAYSNPSNAPLAEKWNGRAWVLQSAPAPGAPTGSGFGAVSCTGSSNCEAVGDYRTASGASYNFAEIWNGTTWAVQTMPSR